MAGTCVLAGPALVAGAMLVHSWNAGPSPAALPLDRALTELSAGVLVGCALWAWVGLTATVLEAVLASWHRVPVDRPARRWRLPGRLHRLVLSACGVALVSGLAAPALAAPHPGQQAAVSVRTLVGLPLPERALAPARVPSAPSVRPATGRTVRVRPGDCLWSLAAADLPPGAPGEAVAARWRQIYAANRRVIGADPGLLLPGQLLVLPPPGPDPSWREEPR